MGCLTQLFRNVIVHIIAKLVIRRTRFKLTVLIALPDNQRHFQGITHLPPETVLIKIMHADAIYGHDHIARFHPGVLHPIVFSANQHAIAGGGMKILQTDIFKTVREQFGQPAF